MPTEKIPLIDDHVDWERPESINFHLYEKTVYEAINNNDILRQATRIETTNEKTEKTVTNANIPNVDCGFSARSK